MLGALFLPEAIERAVTNDNADLKFALDLYTGSILR